jgi:hypothetical protein
MKAKQSYFVDGLLLTGLCVLFFWRVLTPAAADRLIIRPGDFSDQFYTFAQYEASRLHAGQLPLWNPYTFSGHPFLADVQSGVFYPPSLLTLLATAGRGLPYAALEIEAILHFVLAALFTYLLARRLTGGRVGGIVAAVAFTFSGYLTSYPALQLAILETQVWLPLMLLCLDVAGERLENSATGSALRWAIAAGLAFGVSLLAGHPQAGLLVGYAGLAYGLFRFWPSEPRSLRAWRWPAGLLIAWAAGSLIAAVQLIPAAEFTALSGRASLRFEEAGRGFLPYDLLQLIYPALGGGFPALYVGLVPLGLALLAATSVRSSLDMPLQARRTITFFAAVALIGVLLSLGKSLGLYQVAYLLLPGWRLFRGQERVIVWTVFSVALLAGYASAWLANCWQAAGPGPRRPGLTGYAGSGLTRGYLIAAGLALVLSATFFILYQSGRDAAWGFTTASLYLGLILLLAALALSTRQPAALIAVLLLDLFTVNAGRMLKSPDSLDLAPQAALLAPALADQGEFRVVNDSVLPGNYGMLFQLEDTRGSSPLQLSAYSRWLEQLPAARAWQMLNAKYVVSWQQSLDAPAERIGENPNGPDGKPVYLYRLQSPGPRAWLVGSVIVEPDAEQTLDLLAAAEFDPARQVVLDQAAPGIDAADASECGGIVTWQSRTPEYLALSAETQRPCVLVLSELDYPGWRAAVDAAPAAILRADGILRAISLPAGRHDVTLTYRPASVAWGAAISAISLLALLGWLIVSRVLKRP